MSIRASLFAVTAIALSTAALATGAAAAQFTVNHSSHPGTHLHPYPICVSGCLHDHDAREDERERDRRWDFDRRPIYGAPVGVASATVPVAPASAPAPAPTAAGGCLTKRELPDGSALFRDLCTQEEAVSQPPASATAPR
jgi:hypothetical protein